MANQPRLYSFLEDPLAWHSETVISLVDASGTNFNTGLNESKTVIAIPIALRIDAGALDVKTQEKLSQALDFEIDQLKAGFAVTIDRSGVFFFAGEAANNAKKDISRISIGSIAGVIVLLLIAFGSIRALLLPMISIAIGVAFAFVVSHVVYSKVHVLTIVFGASLIGIVIDYSLHYFYHALHSRADERRALHRALLLSLVTSLIGYAALGFSDLQALQKVALFSCCGLVAAWLCVVSLGDLTLSKPFSVDKKIFPAVIEITSNLVSLVRPSRWAVLGVLIPLVAAGVLVSGKSFNDDPRAFFNASTALLESERRVAAVANDYEPGRYLIVYGASEAQVYFRHEKLFLAIDKSDQFQSSDFTSLLTWVPNLDQQRADYASQATLYLENGAVHTLLANLDRLKSFAQIEQDYQAAKDINLYPDQVVQVLSDALPPLWLQTEEAIVNFVLLHKGMDTTGLQALLAPLKGVEYVNTLQRTQNALAEQRQSAGRLLLLAYLLVAAVVLARYRAMSALWLLSVPICSSAMLLIWGTFMGEGLNLFHVMALFLVLGFGMDYMIFTHEIRHRPDITKQAILLSTLTSLLSFGLLALSSIVVVASFGITLLIGNGFNFLGAMIYAQTRRE